MRTQVLSRRAAFAGPALEHAAPAPDTAARETVVKLNPTVATRRRLFALSRNRCAFPGCEHPIVDELGNLGGEICYIEGANLSGYRFNRSQTNEQRRAFDNLVLLCRAHHAATDDFRRYPAEALRRMKAEHEMRPFPPPARGTIERFLDCSLDMQYRLPLNFGELGLRPADESLLIESRRLLERIACLPQLSRSLYAHAVSCAKPGDDFAYFELDELAPLVNESAATVASHLAVLESAGLVDPPQAHAARSPRPAAGRRCNFRGLDAEGHGISFLRLLRTRFAHQPKTVTDIIENLNFRLLDRGG